MTTRTLPSNSQKKQMLSIQVSILTIHLASNAFEFNALTLDFSSVSFGTIREDRNSVGVYSCGLLPPNHEGELVLSEALRNFLFTSESVTEGHPDKIADQISDAVLDEVMKQDPHGRVACETLVTTGLAVVAGEVTTSAHVNYDELVRETIRGVGYDRAKYGFDAETCAVMCTVKRQSPDIAMGVDTGGAGDQGLMFGFACDETDELMPMPIQLAHHLTQRLSEVRKSKKVDFLRPDGKSQVTVEYRNGRPARGDTVVFSTQHDENVSTKNLHEAVMEHVIRPIVPASMLDRNTKYHINPTGRFVI